MRAIQENHQRSGQQTQQGVFDVGNNINERALALDRAMMRKRLKLFVETKQ
jgi:hypothetical protein